jgi:lambda family phage minor tail protein L
MEVNERIATQVQLSDLGQLVELYEVDLTSFGSIIIRFTNSTIGNSEVMFGGNVYSVVPVETEGFEWNGTGALPTPKIRFSNVNNATSISIRSLLLQFNDFLGAPVKRIRTFREFLDDGTQSDPSAMMPVDIYRVDRKSRFDNEIIEFELSASIDQEGKKLPGRQVLRDICPHIYRRYDPATGTFDYEKATCPYNGAACYDRTNTPCAASLDACGKRLSSCKLRFPNQTLPTWAFPGVAQV